MEKDSIEKFLDWMLDGETLTTKQQKELEEYKLQLQKKKTKKMIDDRIKRIKNQRLNEEKAIDDLIETINNKLNKN